jgi:hypothetical protein
MIRQFKTNSHFAFVVPLEGGGFASNYNSLTPAFERYNVAIEERQKRAFGHPFTGGFSLTDCSSGTIAGVTK